MRNDLYLKTMFELYKDNTSSPFFFLGENERIFFMKRIPLAGLNALYYEQ